MSRRAAWLLLAFAAGCSTPGAPDTRRELLESWSTELIVADYAEFETRSSALTTAIDAFCAEPSSANLTSAQSTWTAAQTSLKRAEVFAFGPFSRPGFRIGPHIDSWPARVDEIEEVLAGDVSLDSETVADFGVWRKGLPVIEYLLFPPAGDAIELAQTPRRCEYLRALGVELSSRADELHSTWAPEGGDFAGQLSGAGRTSTAFMSLAAAFGEIVNRMGFTVENIRTNKLGKPLGEDSGGVASPDAAESRFSARSISNILDNLTGIETLFFGDEARQVPGLRRYVAERGADYDQEMRDALANARSSLEGITSPLTEAVMSEPERVRQASDRLRELQNLIQVDLIGVLGLSLNFNDNDGD